MSKGPKVLLLDIETAPILAHVWSIWQQDVGLSQIKHDWHILSWAAKWLGDPPSKTMYKDQRHSKDVSNDKKLLEGIWQLLDEADIIITQNGKQFDQKKLFARFILNDMQPPSTFKHIDTKELASKHFGFTSNKLEYLSDKLCTKYKKQKHKEFAGFEMWDECLKGNLKAWRAMEKYNRYDVLALEELYTKLQPWDNTVDFNLYRDDLDTRCNCGSAHIEKKGFSYTSAGKYQRYRCLDCGSQWRGKENLFSRTKRKALRAKA